MTGKPIVPVVVGRGMAGRAIHEALSIVASQDPELEVMPLRQVPRNEPPDAFMAGDADSVLFIANPSGLHAQFISDGAKAGFSAIASEKPICVRPAEVALLRGISVPVAVFHGYRVQWGTRLIKSMVDAGDLGEVFAFESRYWQYSAAVKALSGAQEKRAWKNDPRLNGPSDALIDLGSHALDICLHLMNAIPVQTRCRLMYRNSAAAHRDTHAQLLLSFPEGRSGLISISKTMHGAPNNFEYTVLGTRGSATWRFLRPDEVEFASGHRTTMIRRENPNASSDSFPFHGFGWLEGYIEIAHQTLRRVAGLSSTAVPTLGEALDAMEVLLSASCEDCD